MIIIHYFLNVTYSNLYSPMFLLICLSLFPHWVGSLIIKFCHKKSNLSYFFFLLSFDCIGLFKVKCATLSECYGLDSNTRQFVTGCRLTFGSDMYNVRSYSVRSLVNHYNHPDLFGSVSIQVCIKIF